MSYNEWLYTINNPNNLVDPSGLDPLAVFDAMPSEYSGFTQPEKQIINSALDKISRRYSATHNKWANRQNNCLPSGIRNFVKAFQIDNITAFLRIHGGKIRFVKYDPSSMSIPWYDKYKNQPNNQDLYIDKATDPISYEGWPATTITKNKVEIYWGRSNGYFAAHDDDCYERFITHEVGHAFNTALPLLPNGEKRGQGTLYHYDNDHDNYLLTNDVTMSDGFAGTQNQCWQRRLNNIDISESKLGLADEVFADQFTGWVYDEWEMERGFITDLGKKRSDFMNRYMPSWIELMVGNAIPWK